MSAHDVEDVAQVELIGRRQRARRQNRRQRVVRGLDLAVARHVEERAPLRLQHRVNALLGRRVEERAGDAGARRVTQVDLVGARIVRIARVTNARRALLEQDARQLDLLLDVGRRLRDLDLAALEDAAMAFVLEVFLVGDEVRQFLDEAQHDIQRLRQLVLLGDDRLDLRLPQHQVVALAVDGVAGLHLERQVAARARVDLQLARITGDDARRVAETIVQLALVEVIALGVVPVVLGGEESFEEVDPLESLTLRVAFGRHLLFLRVLLLIGSGTSCGLVRDRRADSRLALIR